MTSTAPSILSSDHTLQPGGRWERLLTACAAQCLTLGALLRATDPGKHRRQVERGKIFRAVITMAKAGLVESIGDWGWTATAQGRDALAALDLARAADPAARAQAARERDPSDGASIRAQAASLREASVSAQNAEAA